MHRAENKLKISEPVNLRIIAAAKVWNRIGVDYFWSWWYNLRSLGLETRPEMGRHVLKAWWVLGFGLGPEGGCTGSKVAKLIILGLHLIMVVQLEIDLDTYS